MPASSQRINLRTPEVMREVQAKVEQHYRSSLVEQVRAQGGFFSVGQTHFYLAKQFGFCYGVERAIDLAYAARKVFPKERLFLVGEIIHNPEVNAHIAALGIQNLLAGGGASAIESLQPEDVVILPAFGTEISMLEKIKARGCRIVDTTCGDVMSVWKRVKQNATEEVTSIIHGKASHEETKATASRALGGGKGHYLIVLNLEEVQFLVRYLLGEENRESFLKKFAGAFSEGFNPELHLRRIGVANQTTMLRAETEEIQRRLRDALEQRDGSTNNFRFFDTICGATQERQEALLDLMERPLDFLLVVGGYNSSNTTHLAEMGEKKLPTYFIRNQQCLEGVHRLRHFDLHAHEEVILDGAWMVKSIQEPLTVGITAGASCPNNLIEEVMMRLLELRGEDGSYSDIPS
ncbi:MAG: 4-hydroxy-3-methylbut-2-enyl diphosphate reductase [Chthoniobacterales bacterium]